MLKGVSIILCTYNGRDRLDATFQHLLDQKLTTPCELIFVDNASNDGSKAYADAWWQSNKHSGITYSSFVQSKPGKSYAQDMGYDKAQYEYLLVCDDDNWLCDTYIQTAFDLMEQHPDVGALGGWCEGVFESNKPEWFNKYTKYYVVVKQGDQSGDITDKKGCLYGAGMVISKLHWLRLKSLGFEHLLSCRKGDSLSSGGDTEFCYALRLLGYKIWYDERLYFKHFMTTGRLNFNYVSRLRKALVDSNFTLWPYVDMLLGKKRTRKDFLMAVCNEIPLLYTKHLINLIFGNFDQREQSKEQFRYHKHLLFSYSVYEKNWELIQAWTSKINSRKN